MKNLITKFLSIILTLSMIFSLSVPAFATENYSIIKTSDTIGSQEEIEAARKSYLALSPEARSIFDASLSSDPDALEFHKTYINENFNLPTPKIYRRAANISTSGGVNYVNNLMRQLNRIGLPTSVLSSFRALGASIAVDIADGPLPTGTILVTASSLAVITTVALNWDIVSPKFNQISRAFQSTFSKAASNISAAFAKIKSEAKKESDKNKKKEKQPTGNRVKDVHKRLKKEGFIKVRQNGSHGIWKKGNRTVPVPDHGSNYEIPIGTLRNIWKLAGWI